MKVNERREGQEDTGDGEYEGRKEGKEKGEAFREVQRIECLGGHRTDYLGQHVTFKLSPSVDIHRVLQLLRESCHFGSFLQQFPGEIKQKCSEQNICKIGC
jgi:hypothetical protein